MVVKNCLGAELKTFHLASKAFWGCMKEFAKDREEEIYIWMSK